MLPKVHPLGLEPRTYCPTSGAIAPDVTSHQQVTAEEPTAQAANRSRNVGERCDEGVTALRERLASALIDIARDTEWSPDSGIDPGVWSDAGIASVVADRCNQLLDQQERLKLRVAALKRRARALGVRVGDAYASRDPFVLCSDALPPMYVYALVSTAAPTVYRYIGCTDSPHQRLSAHLSNSAATLVREWVRDTLRSGHLVQMVELWRGADRLEAEAQEERTIADYVALGMADLNVHGNTVAYAGHRRPVKRGAAA